jgi:NADH dehydrogenase
MRTRRDHIVILGGGFAGLGAALEIRSDRRVTLVDASPWFEFLPNIHELVSGVKRPELLRLNRRRIVERAGHRFVRDRVTSIDLADRRVQLERGPALGYDALIVALGGVNATHGVPGVDEHALPFKSVDDCARIGARLRELARSGEREEVVIVGGGLEGVEALGEILRAYRNQGCFRIHVVEARDRLLPEAAPVLDPHVRELCAPYDVHFWTGARVARVEPDAVLLDTGRRLSSRATLWTGGPAAPPLLAEAGLAPRAGAWAPVEASLQAIGHPQVFAAGDSAELPSPISKQAYHALDMGRSAARNADRLLRGQRLNRFRPSGKPMLVSFGDLTCFAASGRWVLAGPALAGAKEAVYELVMAQLDREEIWRVVPAVAERLHQAARSLLWPSLSSVESLCRQARLSVLSFG